MGGGGVGGGGSPPPRLAVGPSVRGAGGLGGWGLSASQSVRRSVIPWLLLADAAPSLPPCTAPHCDRDSSPEDCNTAGPHPRVPKGTAPVLGPALAWTPARPCLVMARTRPRPHPDSPPPSPLPVGPPDTSYAVSSTSSPPWAAEFYCATVFVSDTSALSGC